MEKQRLDNPIMVPRVLSFLTYQRWMAEVKGLDAFPQEQLAGQHPAALLQLPHHGRARARIFIAVMVASAAVLLWKRPAVRAPRRCCGS